MELLCKLFLKSPGKIRKGLRVIEHGRKEVWEGGELGGRELHNCISKLNSSMIIGNHLQNSIYTHSVLAYSLINKILT